jgi:ATP-dependent helicase/nuclease subunit A
VANGRNDQLIQLLQQETGLDPAKILDHARQALSLILHDYDRFSISTIDSFFQKVLRSFAREAGLYGTYEISLDQQAVMEEACDRLLMGVEDDLELRKWLTAMSEEQLEAGRNWQINQQILTLGKELYNEAFQPYLLQHEGTEIERAKIRALQKSLNSTIKSFESELQARGEQGLKLIANSGLEMADFKGGSRTFLSYFRYWAEKRTDKLEPTATLLKAIDDPEQWSIQKSPKRAAITAAFHSGLNTHLKNTLAFIKKNEANFISAVELLRYLHTLGVLTTLLSKVREIGQERNAMLLSEGNALLRGIIGNNDAPFVYEKTGTYFNHFMIDEFQDTSLSQWDNFKPLVGNSLAENHSNLVVGDVKQSIYRWRNSDWQLLDRQIKNDLKTFKVEEVNLDGNWRSAEKLVHFNNRFFALGCQLLQKSFNAEIQDAALPELEHFKQTIETAYIDVEQQVKSSRKGGVVQCMVVDKEKSEEFILQKVIETVKLVQDHGYKARDIAILVRRNNEGKQMAEALLNAKKNPGNYNFEVISDDTLFIETSAAVRMLVQLFKHILQPHDEIAKANVVHEFDAFLLPVLRGIGKQPPRFSLQKQTSLDFESASNDGDHFLPPGLVADYFPFFQQVELKYQVQQWSHRSLIDLTDELIDRYNLGYLAGEQANLQAFRDVVNDFTKREGGNLRLFIDWWDQFGAKIKLQTAGERDAIRIMTIHKSKGLEFPIVILPFCNWKFVPETNRETILWCSTQNTPFQDFPVLPLKNTKALRRSHFVHDYYTELLLSYIDNLNLLYVAQTRAIEGLYLFTEASEGDVKTVSQLYHHLLTESNDPSIPKAVEPGIYRLGTLNKKEQAIDSFVSEVNLSSGVNLKRNISHSLRLKQNSLDFLETDTHSRSARINRGKLVHELFSFIETSADLDIALLKFRHEGKAGPEDLQELRLEVEQLLAQPLPHEWFSGVYKVLNERTLILPGFELQRPDRIMIGNGKVLVVDYKVSETILPAHFRQVKRYCESILKMGFEKVEGYLWYLKSNQIINVYDHE